MHQYKYLIIGGGMTADSAVKGIRENDKGGSIGVISSEKNPPYNRPPLTKDLWKGKPEEKIWRGTDKLNADLILETEAVSLDADGKKVKDNKGEDYRFDNLLLATGGTPTKLPYGGDNIIYFRTFDDYRHLRDLSKQHNSFAVIGGGFIGSEIAAALAMNGEKVKMIFPDEGICARIFPEDISRHLNEYYTSKGVEILNREKLENTNFNGKASLILKSGKKVDADAVIAGIGIKPNTRLAESADLKVDNGITVDEFLRTSIPYIYAAGDAANFYNPALGERIRVEHEDNANKMGRHAGEVMAGDEKPYNHLPFFYSDLFEIGYEAVGELDSRYETFIDWKEPYKEGVIYYLKDGRVKGVLLWNVWKQVNAARELIAEKGPFKSQDLKGRLPKN
jgi:3-phenylpropionate/trans-cinnamate dioxygenase ferredoxin reductase component